MQELNPVKIRHLIAGAYLVAGVIVLGLACVVVLLDYVIYVLECLNGDYAGASGFVVKTLIAAIALGTLFLGVSAHARFANKLKGRSKT